MAGADPKSEESKRQLLLGLDRVGATLPGVARRAIESFLGGEGYGVVSPDGPRASVFVTLLAPSGTLRGCVGSTLDGASDVVSETARSAVGAATRDGRFAPVSLRELATLGIVVSVVVDQEPIDDASALDPDGFGLIVRDDVGRVGVLFPGLDDVPDAPVQIATARRKAGIANDAKVTLTRFRVRSFAEYRAAPA